MKTVSCESCGGNELIELDSGRICAFCRAQFVEDPQIFAPDGKIAGYACARCGLVDRVTLYGARYTTQEYAAQIYLGELESSVPCALFGDPFPNDFNSQKTVLDEVMACDRCACLTYKGVEIEPGEFCESTFGSFGMLRMYEHWAVGEYLANATFGTSVFRKEVACSSREVAQENFDSLSRKTPFDEKIETFSYFHTLGSSTVWIARGQTGSQWKAQAMGGFRKVAWWPTTTLVSAMFNTDSNLAIYSVISSADYVNNAKVDWGIATGYEKKFQELSRLLD